METMSRTLIAMAAAAALQSAPGPAPAAAEDRIFLASGYVSNGGDEGGGWIQFSRSRQRFRLPANTTDVGRYADLVSTSLNGRVALRVRYDATRGRGDATGGYVEYPICSMSIAQGASVGDEQANCPAAAAATAPGVERDLAVGLAMVPTRPAEARQLLTRALDGRALRGSLRAIAFEARGDAASILADRLPPASEDYDRAIADALADYRAWVVADPNDPAAQYAAASALIDLGGYDEALDVYRAIGRRWPEEGYSVAVDIGALYRRQGRYAEALRSLDDYAARNGPQEGMRFHYHRAWTLNLLGRPREAIEAIAAGLRSQADYPFAFFMRACSHAKLGQIRDALADQERGLALLSAAARDNPDAYARDLETARASAEELRGLAAARSRRPTEAACNRLWQRNLETRSRSPLLGTPRS